MTPAARPQTIQIFLPLGDPRGIRIAEITTRIVQLIEVPRPQLDVFLAMPESEQVAVYFLFGQSDDGAEPKVYIGQTGDLRKRLASHNKDKDFWQRALVLISRTGSLTQTHGLFLEWQCIQAARDRQGLRAPRLRQAPQRADRAGQDRGRGRCHRVHRGRAVRLAERRVGGGVRGGVERVAGLEDGARGDAERGEAGRVRLAWAGGLRPQAGIAAWKNLVTRIMFNLSGTCHSGRPGRPRKAVTPLRWQAYYPAESRSAYPASRWLRIASTNTVSISGT